MPGDMLHAASTMLDRAADTIPRHRVSRRVVLALLATFIEFTTLQKFADRLPPGSAPTDANPEVTLLHWLESYNNSIRRCQNASR